MTSVQQNAFEKAKNVPDHCQDEVGKMLLDLMQQDNSNLRLSEDQQVEVRRRLAKNSDLVSESEMTAFFRNLTNPRP
jgi:hypothetical protein